MTTLQTRLKQFMYKIIASCASCVPKVLEVPLADESRSRYEKLVIDDHIPLDLAVTSLIYGLLQSNTNFREQILNAVNASNTHVLLDSDSEVINSFQTMINYFGLNNWISLDEERKREFLKEYKEVLFTFKKNIQQNKVFCKSYEISLC